MNIIQDLHSAWLESLSKLNKTYWFQRLAVGDLALKHYVSLLRETYYNVSLNTQILSFATMYFKGEQRIIIKKLLQHAIAESGHEFLAENDLKALGEDTSMLDHKRALPTTIALNAFPLFEIQFNTPISLLGYIYHLENIPTQSGEKYLKELRAMGVPENALTFIKDHAEVDVAHNKFMDHYLSHFIKTPKDLDTVIYAAKATCTLHCNMISAAFDNAEDNSGSIQNIFQGK